MESIIMDLNIKQISYEIIERFAETRLTHNLANFKIDVMRRDAFDEVAIRLRARMVDDVVWQGTTKEWRVPTIGIWNSILNRIPFGWAQRWVKTVKFREELHIHHTCPHITIPINGKAHFEWMEQGK